MRINTKKSLIHLPDDIEELIKKRLRQFKGNSGLPEEYWFSELCFCILTANSRADTALKIQAEIGPDGFCTSDRNTICDCIKKFKHRFHNNKTKFILNAREYNGLKKNIMRLANKSQNDARTELVNNIKGIGLKEASHFMRNMGYEDLAILDRHILRFLVEANFIEKIPKRLTEKIYLSIEKEFQDLARNLGITPSELDLRMWYLKTGKVLK